MDATTSAPSCAPTMDPTTETPAKMDEGSIEAQRTPDDLQPSTSSITDLNKDIEEPKFTLFPKLPLELRIFIWKLAIPPRVIVVSTSAAKTPVEYGSFEASTLLCTTPIISKVVKEARDVFLKQYTLVEAGEYPHTCPQDRLKPFYVEFARDTLFAKDGNALFWFVEATKGSEHVKRLAFDEHLYVNLWHHTHGFLASYRSLETLFLPRQSPYFYHMPLSTEDFEKDIVRRLKNGYIGTPGEPSLDADVRFVEASEMNAISEGA
ncbi:uncharacterized protein PAC_18866 [Phialocephala subalpina]|uniref:2EXR domain-containing protein n=1 Tax=Phialocephala subalpina TaxID=576137 RepID=A0A1L7XVG3_9HELO|nr:uncharacterized protein PAC_18866 [Phialocephala subalpina]